ncbi:major facilitator superfamily multidrug-resistance protein [Scheffersomyces coipomensis]|uniref:major facilitator superfamily multidrug-resistance protein n=1 Tax=Scheffersomyces coipomensis TaxID=1788519 RepID=UPI00315CB519
MSFSGDIEKGSHDHIENIEDSSQVELDLSPEHEAYLIERHGTAFLDPLPSSDPKDPLNWPIWKKNAEILIVAFHTFTTAFMASGLIPAFQTVAVKLDVPLANASYLTSVQIMVVGAMPFFWLPIMNAYGRNGIAAISCLVCCALNIGSAFSESYAGSMALRAVIAAFFSTGYAAGSSIVADLSFAHERGKKNGWWSVALVTGTTAGPFVCGFIEQHAGTRWIYFTFSFMCFALFILWTIADETVYVRHHETPQPGNWFNSKVLRISRNPDQQLSFSLFMRPFSLITNFNVMMSILTLSIVFCYANIVLVVELPQAMGVLFQLDPQHLSYQFIALIIGSAIGEFLAGPLSDWWMKKSVARRGGVRVISDRLWVSYNGFICVVVGLVVWGVYLDRAVPGHWIITPLIGGAIAACGNNIVMTVLTTFAIESAPGRATEAGLLITLFRQTYAFIGPFYFPYMFDTLGFSGSAGLMCGLVAVFGAGPVIICHVLGSRKQGS